MKPANIAAVLSISLVALAGGAGSVLAQEKGVDLGKREYDSNCASCHGITGKGDGPYRQYLTKTPADLTVLSKKNGGVFPLEKVESIIDGRQEVGAHGPREMPIWGREYSLMASEGLYDITNTDSWVWTRIIALTEYVFRLQAK